MALSENGIPQNPMVYRHPLLVNDLNGNLRWVYSCIPPVIKHVALENSHEFKCSFIDDFTSYNFSIFVL